MNEELFTAVLALAWFGAVNLAASAAAAGLAWVLKRGVVRLPASAEPGALLGVKLLPGAAALLFTALVFLPPIGVSSPKARTRRPATRSRHSRRSERSR